MEGKPPPRIPKIGYSPASSRPPDVPGAEGNRRGEGRVERVGTVLRHLEGVGNLRRRIAEAHGLASWTEIVGHHLAQRTRAVGLAGGRLFVVCHGSALRQELSFHRREILRRFREFAGSEVVAREIVFLETDANLSSLLREAEARAPAASRAEPAPTEGPPDEEASVAWRIAASYPRFDGAKYREELRRIAEDR
jgi:hypothetical protein